MMVWAAAIRRARAACLHIALHDGNKDNKKTAATTPYVNYEPNSARAVSYHASCNGNDNNKNGTMPLFSTLRRTMATMITTSYGIKHRCNNQPGNIKHRRAQATASNIDTTFHWQHHPKMLLEPCLSSNIDDNNLLESQT
jgi:hypothetical protein